jgi:xanthine dehydrogenase YagS FAD-binding subunit
MNPFKYLSPPDTDAALGALGDEWGPTEILAGGTDLLALIKDYVVTPDTLVNIKRIGELRHVTFNPQAGLRVGCLIKLDELAQTESVKKFYPTIAASINDAASPQIRNMATVGGNLCQRPRCWYFRNGFGLLALDKGGNSLVLRGDNRYHAVLGNAGPAFFVSPSTIAPVLIAFGASVTVRGQKGERTMPLERFYRIPKSEQEREHDLGPNELVTELSVPAPRDGTVSAYYEVRQKHGFDWPVATATVVLKLEEKRVTEASVVLGHVAPVPWRSREAEAALVGKTVDAESAAAASVAALAAAKSLGQNGYKIQVARVALKRAILQAGGFDVPPPHPSSGGES